MSIPSSSQDTVHDEITFGKHVQTMVVVALMMVVAGLSAAVLTDGTAQAATGDRLDRSKLTLTFEESFTGPLSLWDPRSGTGRWKTCYWFGWQPPGQGCVDKSSRTIDTDGSQYVLVDWTYNKVNPFQLSNGLLTIEAARNAYPDDPKTAGRAYTTGVITSEPSFSQRYGYFEIRTQLPAGSGLWPAFWMVPADHAVPFELDVMENHGSDPNTIYCTAHWDDGTYTLFPIKVDGIGVQQQRTYGAPQVPPTLIPATGYTGECRSLHRRRTKRCLHSSKGRLSGRQH